MFPVIPVLVRILLADREHQADAIGAGEITVARADAETEVGAYIKTFEVGIHGGIHHIQSPEQNYKEGGVINVPPELIAVELQGLFTNGFQVIPYLAVEGGVGTTDPHIVFDPVGKPGSPVL